MVKRPGCTIVANSRICSRRAKRAKETPGNKTVTVFDYDILSSNFDLVSDE